MKNKTVKTLSELAEAISLYENDTKLDIDVEKQLDNSEELQKQDGKTKKIAKAIGKVIANAVKSFTANKCGDLIDELLLGQFKDAIVDIYKKDHLDKIDDTEAQKELETLQKENSKFKQGVDKQALDSRTDDETSTDIDTSSEKFSALWYSKNKEENVGQIISNLVADIQKQAKDMENEQKTAVAEIKKLKIKDITDEDIANFGPILSQMIKDKKSSDEITKKLKELRSGVKESINKQISILKNKALLTESKFILTEKIKNELTIKALCERQEFQNLVVEQLINEGFFGKAFDKFTSKISDKVNQKIKDFGAKTIKTITSKTTSAILSLGGIALSVATGGWAATLALKAIYAVERHGKVLRNAFERQYTRFANSKGIITEMNFSLKDKKDSKYAMRFYVKDMVWRVLNLQDQLKQPDLNYSKEIVNGEEGKKYRQQLAKIWDPLFASNKGGKIDFVELFKQAKELNIPEKQLKMYQDFAENYDKIKANCIDSPKIDTRTQSLKKDKLDK